MKDSAGTRDGAEPALNKSRLDVRSRVLPRWVPRMSGSIPVDPEEVEMWCVIH